MGLGSTRAEASQLVSHKSVLVNGVTFNIASYQVSAEDIISIKEKSKSQTRIQDSLAISDQYGLVSSWITVDSKKREGVFKSIHERMDLPSDIK